MPLDVFLHEPSRSSEAALEPLTRNHRWAFGSMPLDEHTLAFTRVPVLFSV